MKRLLLIIILTFSFQSWTKAENIRDFEIEGMSIGGSVLDFMSKKEIKENYIDYGGVRKFYATNYNKNLSKFDKIEVWLKTNDKKFTIYSINAGIYTSELNECIKKRDLIVESVRSLFLNIKYDEGQKRHDAYKDSKQYISQFEFDGSDDNVRVECVIFGKDTKKKYGFEDHLSVKAQSDESVKWIIGGYK